MYQGYSYEYAQQPQYQGQMYQQMTPQMQIPTEVIDWDAVASIDPELVRRTGDLTQLKPFLSQFASANLNQYESQVLQHPLAVRLCSILQISLQYMTSVQKQLDEKVKKLESRLEDKSQEMKKLEVAFTKADELLRKKMQSTEKCPLCLKKFKNWDFVDQHVERRHPEHLEEWLSIRNKLPRKQPNVSHTGKTQDIHQLLQKVTDLQNTIRRDREQRARELPVIPKATKAPHEARKTQQELFETQQELMRTEEIQDDLQMTHREDMKSDLQVAVDELNSSWIAWRKQSKAPVTKNTTTKYDDEEDELYARNMADEVEGSFDDPDEVISNAREDASVKPFEPINPFKMAMMQTAEVEVVPELAATIKADEIVEESPTKKKKHKKGGFFSKLFKKKDKKEKKPNKKQERKEKKKSKKEKIQIEPEIEPSRVDSVQSQFVEPVQPIHVEPIKPQKQDKLIRTLQRKPDVPKEHHEPVISQTPELVTEEISDKRKKHHSRKHRSKNEDAPIVVAPLPETKPELIRRKEQVQPETLTVPSSIKPTEPEALTVPSSIKPTEPEATEMKEDTTTKEDMAKREAEREQKKQLIREKRKMIRNAKDFLQRRPQTEYNNDIVSEAVTAIQDMIALTMREFKASQRPEQVASILMQKSGKSGSKYQKITNKLLEQLNQEHPLPNGYPQHMSFPTSDEEYLTTIKNEEYEYDYEEEEEEQEEEPVVEQPTTKAKKPRPKSAGHPTEEMLAKLSEEISTPAPVPVTSSPMFSIVENTSEENFSPIPTGPATMSSNDSLNTRPVTNEEEDEPERAEEEEANDEITEPMEEENEPKHDEEEDKPNNEVQEQPANDDEEPQPIAITEPETHEEPKEAPKQESEYDYEYYGDEEEDAPNNDSKDQKEAPAPANLFIPVASPPKMPTIQRHNPARESPFVVSDSDTDDDQEIVVTRNPPALAKQEEEDGYEYVYEEEDDHEPMSFTPEPKRNTSNMKLISVHPTLIGVLPKKQKPSAVLVSDDSFNLSKSLTNTLPQPTFVEPAAKDDAEDEVIYGRQGPNPEPESSSDSEDKPTLMMTDSKFVDADSSDEPSMLGSRKPRSNDFISDDDMHV